MPSEDRDEPRMDVGYWRGVFSAASDHSKKAQAAAEALDLDGFLAELDAVSSAWREIVSSAPFSVLERLELERLRRMQMLYVRAYRDTKGKPEKKLRAAESASGIRDVGRDVFTSNAIPEERLIKDFAELTGQVDRRWRAGVSWATDDEHASLWDEEATWLTTDPTMWKLVSGTASEAIAKLKAIREGDAESAERVAILAITDAPLSPKTACDVIAAWYRTQSGESIAAKLRAIRSRAKAAMTEGDEGVFGEYPKHLEILDKLPGGKHDAEKKRAARRKRLRPTATS
jgi:hypothetical protein